MANPWFRLYSEFLDDPKVQLLPEHMRYRLVALLCSRCKTPDLTDQVIAFQWRMPLSDVQETKSLFISQGFIDASWKVIAWDRRQYVSDNAGDRVRRFRAKGNVTASNRYMERPNSVSSNTPDTEQIQSIGSSDDF